MIQTFSKEIIAKNEKIISNCLEHYVSKEALVLANELIEIQTQVNIEKEGNFRNIKNKKQLIKMVIPDIKKSLEQNAYNFGHLNYIKLFPEKLLLILSEKIRKHYIYLITDISTKNVINSKIKEQFQKILSSIEKMKIKK